MKRLMCLFYYLAIGVCLTFISCSDNKKNESQRQDEVMTDSLKVRVYDTSFADNDLSEALSKLIEIDGDEYPLEIEGDKVTLSIKIRGNMTSKDKDKIKENINKLSNATIEIALRDDDNTEIGNQRLQLVDSSLPELLEWTFANEYFDKKEVKFQCNHFSAMDKIKNVYEVKIYAVDGSAIVQDKMSDNKQSNSDNNNSSEDEDLGNSIDEDDLTSNSSNSSGSEDWNAVLNSYEKYVDKYISYIKKAQAGDASALAEYPSLLEEANEFSNKLQNASDELSPSQLARYQRITTKLLSAAK